MALDAQTEKELLEKVGKEATTATKKEIEETEKRINQKAEDLAKGLFTQKEFDDFKKEQLEPISKKLDMLLETTKAQGNKINAITEKSAPNTKSLEQYLIEKLDSKNGEWKDLRSSGKHVVITGEQLKAAGVYSIAGTIPTASPYAPGVGGAQLDIFDILRNPNFITSRVDLGRTDLARMAWANELDTIQGGASANVAEGTLKPQIQHQFSVETSTAKKAAGWVELTEEFNDDLPQFATRVRRMVQEDVERAWDDQIQADIIAAAPAYSLSGLAGKIAAANYWDALLAMLAQPGFFNFIPNTAAMNYLTDVLVQTEKNANDTYLLPAFANRIQQMQAFANKITTGNALVGDLKQYHVDIYKDFQLKVGWINDELIFNKFAIVGEMRYHSYISTARKKALVFDSLDTVVTAINKAS